MPLPNDGSYEYILPHNSCDKVTNQYSTWLTDVLTTNCIFLTGVL